VVSSRKGSSVSLQKILPRIDAPASKGLTAEQARERLINGYGNSAPVSAERTVTEILRDNVCTYFNLVFFILALLVALVGSFKNLTFFPIVLINTAIGIIQELRARKTLSRLKLETEPNAVVIRGGEVVTLPADQVVLDDIALFSAGNRIYADAVVVSGECRVNEALVTGEADEVVKQPGSTLLSGSFVVSGTCRARLDKVGADAYAAQLTAEAKKQSRDNQSVILKSLTRLVQVIGFLIIPLGIALYIQQSAVLGRSVTDSVVSTVGALVGMIPEGLYLLVSIALTVSVLRLAQKKTLVHNMGCIETLARVDVLCVDKTGTITETTMSVSDVIPLGDVPTADIEQLLSDYAAAMEADNETMRALKVRFSGKPRRRPSAVMPFSSEKKFSAATFMGAGTFILGAPEKILPNAGEEVSSLIAEHSSRGGRVLLLAQSAGALQDLPVEDTRPLALVVLSNAVRPEAPRTFEYFTNQGVTIKVISGDNPVTASSVAQQAGIPGAEQYVDASTLTTHRKLLRAVQDYTVFGRVTPDQKRRLVRALKAHGHTVAMTGDGVNDVLALKEADCSIAMASGSDVACHVSQLVLLDSNFSSLPSVVAEGRRVINNIGRSASLYLTKNIFSFLLTICALIFALQYPVTPSQLILYNAAFIGIPSFVLALEPNTSRVRGKFLASAFLRALPAGLVNFLALMALLLLTPRYGITDAELFTMATYIIGFVGLLMLIRLCLPFTPLRIALCVAMTVLFCGGAVLLSPLFSLAPLSGRAVLITVITCVASVPLFAALSLIAQGLNQRALARESRSPSRKAKKILL
jgi:cation-transporting ATPase E